MLKLCYCEVTQKLLYQFIVKHRYSVDYFCDTFSIISHSYLQCHIVIIVYPIVHTFIYFNQIVKK